MNSSEENCGFIKEDKIITQKIVVEEESVLLPVDSKDTCIYCKAVPIDQEIKTHFKIAVCYTCNRSKLKFITKTTCKDSYLLTDSELKQFSCLSRPNPHKGTWNDMQLYLEDEVKKYSYEKFGSEEEINKIKSEKSEKKKAAKLKKIKKRVKELKRRTFLREVEDKHVHKFNNRNGHQGICNCGMIIDEEEL